MPDILGATNPVPGHERTTVNRTVQLPVENDRVQNIVDPSRVSRPDGRTEQQDNNLQGDGKIRYDSNFQVFLKRLQSTPDMAESLRKIFAEGFSVLSGIREGTASEIASLVGMLQMSEAELLQFLSGQIKSGSPFGGALFALLRNAYARADSQAVQKDILQFLRSYSDYFASDHIEGNILRNLSRMADAMPASWAEKLRAMTEQLEALMAGKDRQGALQLLQRGVFSHMGQYVERSHDMGLPRMLLTLLSLDVARYQNGSPEKLLELFHQIRGYGTLKNQLSEIDDRTLLALLERNRADQNSSAVKFANHLSNAAAQALKGGVDTEVQQAFQELVRALLINESVYMPLNHYLLPLEMNGRMLFSELWVDPDDQQEQEGGTAKRSIKCLFKMDVEGLGLMDVILVSRDKEVDVQISCGDRILPFSNQIEKAVDTILRRNELVPARVSVRRMDRPVKLTEVFPQIFERRDSLNVKV